MRRFTAREARAIADKLGCGRRAGRKHDIMQVVVEGKLVAHFGIRRGSGEQGHDYVPAQLHLSRGWCWKLHDCTMSRSEYVAVLRGKGLLP